MTAVVSLEVAVGTQEEIDQLMSSGGEGINWEQLQGKTAVSEEASAELLDHNLGLVRDVPVRVRVELGRGKLRLRDVLRLCNGSVVELDKLAGDPLDIYVNDRLVAKGEVLVLNENFCVRITEVCMPEQKEKEAEES